MSKTRTKNNNENLENKQKEKMSEQAEETLSDSEDLDKQETIVEDQTKHNNEGSENNKAEEDKPTEKEDQVSQEDAELDKEEIQNRYLRLAADFQNYKKRIEKEKNDIYAYANEDIITQLLSVLDNFDRALSVECMDKAFRDGMVMVKKQLQDVLENNGLKEINAQDEEFDPNYHHAVVMEKVDTHESGKITDVLQKGYLLNNKVIRPSMVKVAE